MKQKHFVLLLAIEATLCMFLTTMRDSLAGAFSSIATFPFEQIGIGLRALSLSGLLGNVVAFLLYVAICLLPCAFVFKRRKRGLFKEDALLFLLGVLLFFVLYWMINPGLLGSVFGKNAGLVAEKAILGITVYSVICTYVVLRLLRLFDAGGLERLQIYMKVLLFLLNLLFVYLIFGAGLGKLLDSFASLKAGNAGNEHLLTTSYVFLVLQFVVDSLPYALNIVVVFSGMALLHELSQNRYSAASVASAQNVSKRCRVVLTITVLSNVAFNLLQLLFAKQLLVVNNSMQMPLFSIAFVLATLLLSRFIAENKALKDDNDSII